MQYLTETSQQSQTSSDKHLSCVGPIKKNSLLAEACPHSQMKFEQGDTIDFLRKYNSPETKSDKVFMVQMIIIYFILSKKFVYCDHLSAYFIFIFFISDEYIYQLGNLFQK